MSIIIYQCDTCKREAEIVQDNLSFDLVNSCVITDGCRGSLYKIGERTPGVFGKPVPDVVGLDNFIPRVTFNVFEQTLSNSSWKIEHNLNANPLVHVYIDVVVGDIRTQVLQDIDDYVVVYIDSDNIQIDFAEATTGTVHSISRSTKPRPADSITATAVVEQITANSILTIGSLFRDVNPLTFTLEMNFISPSTGVVSSVDVDFTSHEYEGSPSFFNTPWQTVSTMSVGGNVYKLRSVRISDIISVNDIETGSPFYFSNNENWIILLSSSPYAVTLVDINTTQFVYPEVLSPDDTNPNSLSASNELFIDLAVKTEYHPEIKITTTIFE